MSTPATSNPAKDILVGMGQIAAGQAPQRMRAILGILHRPGPLSPEAQDRASWPTSCCPNRPDATAHPGKFADTAVPHMLTTARRTRRRRPAALVAKLAGGANMFGGSGPLQIGEANAEAVAAALQNAGIRVAGQDVGGSQGRRVDFDFATRRDDRPVRRPAARERFERAHANRTAVPFCSASEDSRHGQEHCSSPTTP